MKINLSFDPYEMKIKMLCVLKNDENFCCFSCFIYFDDILYAMNGRHCLRHKICVNILFFRYLNHLFRLCFQS